MNCKKTTTILSIVMALTMVLTMMSGLFVSAEPELTGSITLQAPKDPNNEGQYVDLGDMEVKAYRVLDEENPKAGVAGSFFTVNADFVDFFKTASETFYAGDTYVKDGKVVSDKAMHFTYDGEKLVLSEVKPSGSELFITISSNQLNELVVSDPEHKYFAAAVMAAMMERSDSDDEADASVANAENTKILAEWLRKYAESKKISSIPQKVTDGTPDSIKFEGLQLGYWLLVSEDAPSNVANVETVFKLARQDGSTDKVVAELKLETQEIDKQVKNEKHSGEDYGDTTTAEAGDILNYRVEMNIPDLRDYDGSQLLNEDETKDQYKYQVRDTLRNQWLVDDNDARVSGDVTNFFDNHVFTVTLSWLDEYGIEQKIVFKDINSIESGINALNDILKTGGESTYGTYDPSGHTQKFVLDFGIDKLRNLELQKGGWREAKLTVEYSAELTSDAVLRNDNDVTLDYSNDPKTTKTPTPPTDKTTAFSYGFEFEKTFQKDGDTNFSAADEGYADLVKDVTFQLFKATGTDGKITDQEKLPVEFVGEEGNYRAADSVDPANTDKELLATEKTVDLKLAADGSLHVYGLDAGYYVLQETAAPNGYARINEIIVYLDDNQDGNLHLLTENSRAIEGDAILGNTTNSTQVQNEGAIENYLSFAVRNRKGFNLPTTGGAGVWMLTIGGLLLIVLAGAMIISRRGKHIAE